MTCWVDSVMAGQPWPVVFAVIVGLWLCGALLLGVSWVAWRSRTPLRRPVQQPDEPWRHVTIAPGDAKLITPDGEPYCCPECDRTSHFALLAEDLSGAGFRTWIRCQCGHRGTHPLLTYTAVLMMAQQMADAPGTKGDSA